MFSPLFLRDFEDRLLHHPSISRRYARRVIAELEDHYHELHNARVKSGCNLDEAARLAQEQLVSDPDVLLAELVRGQGGKSFAWLTRAIGLLTKLAREHALSAFVLLPILAFLGTYLGCKVVGFSIYSLIVDGFHVSNMNAVLRYSVDKIFYATAKGATPLLALAFCRLAVRANRSFLLALLACMLLSLMGGMLKLDLVQCTAGRDVAYFRRFGPDVARLTLPMLAFAMHGAYHLVRASRRSLSFA